MKQNRAEAIKLARTAKRLIGGRGKNLVLIDMVKDEPDDDTLAAFLLGRTGNLKAPTLRIGDTLLVGFNETAYRKMLGI